MIESMTGFGRGAAAREGLQVLVELRSVNSRFFEAQLRLPNGLQKLEGIVRERLQSRLTRGKVACQVELVQASEAGGMPVLNADVAHRYVGELRRLREIAGLVQDPDWATWVRLPGLFTMEAISVEEEVAELVVDALDQALEELQSMRRVEGRALARDLRARVARIEERLARVEELASVQGDRIRERLEERVAALLEPGQVPEERLAMEIALIAERSDITEETVRFRSHDAQFIETLDRGGEVGRRLTFLLQEMNREANTLSSKAGDAEILHLAVELKEEVEKLREQVQNLA